MKAKVLLSTLPLPCVLCLGYICGIAVFPWGLAGLFAGAVSGLWAGAFLRKTLVTLLFITGIGLGFAAAASAMGKVETIQTKGDELVRAGEKNLVVVVIQAAEQAGSKVLLVGHPVNNQHTGIRIESRQYFPALPGDTITITGIYSPLETDPESTFQYPVYLAKNGIGAVFRGYEGSIIRPGTPSFQRSLAIVRRASLERIASLWPGDAGALIAGILVGARGSFSEELVEAMRNTGLMHIVAVSGSNMTILINAILVITGGLAMRWRVILCTVTLALFTLFVGPSGAVVRACLMGVIALLAKLYARPSTAFLCLVYAATIMLVFSPLDLLYDIGFQLSFLAVLGLLWGEPCMRPFCAWLPSFLADQLRPTMAAIAWTLPVSIVYFGSVSLVAPLANLVVPPTIPLLMLGSFIGFLVSWTPGIDVLLWPLTFFVGTYTNLILWISSLLAGVPYAAIPVTIETAWAQIFAAGCYGFLAFWAYRVARTAPSHSPAPQQQSRSTV